MKRNSMVGMSAWYDAIEASTKDLKYCLKGNSRLFGVGAARRKWLVRVDIKFYEESNIESSQIISTSFKPTDKLYLGRELSMLVNTNFTETINNLEIEYKE